MFNDQGEKNEKIMKVNSFKNTKDEQ